MVRGWSEDRSEMLTHHMLSARPYLIGLPLTLYQFTSRHLIQDL